MIRSPLAVAAAAAALLAPSAHAAAPLRHLPGRAPASSCAAYPGVAGWASGFDDSIQGYVSVGLDLSSLQTIVHSTVDARYCGGSVRIGERFYLRVRTTDVQGGGEAPLATVALRLPDGLYPAVDASNPLRCVGVRLSDGAVDTAPPGICPSSLALDASAGGGWSEGFPWSTSATYTTGQARIPAGWAYETIVPVVATHPFHGIGGARSTFAWGGIRLDWVGVAADGVSAPTDYAHGYQPVFVGDRAPELSYPSSPVSDLTDTSATLSAFVANFWKAGSAVMEYGTTTAYGGTTAPDPIPGDDPTFAAYRSTVPVTGLTPGTLYHWRVRFTSGALTAVGPDRTFRTTGTAPRDTRAPRVSIARPASTRLAAWATLRGSAVDPAPSSGLDRVEANVVLRVGRTCRVLAPSGRMAAKACAAASRTWVVARVAGAAWTLPVRGLVPGVVTVRVRAADRARHVGPVAVRSATLRR